jgi:hypothetical protein
VPDESADTNLSHAVEWAKSLGVDLDALSGIKVVRAALDLLSDDKKLDKTTAAVWAGMTVRTLDRDLIAGRGPRGTFETVPHEGAAAIRRARRREVAIAREKAAVPFAEGEAPAATMTERVRFSMGELRRWQSERQVRKATNAKQRTQPVVDTATRMLRLLRRYRNGDLNALAELQEVVVDEKRRVLGFVAAHNWCLAELAGMFSAGACIVEMDLSDALTNHEWHRPADREPWQRVYEATLEAALHRSVSPERVATGE